ncbi:MAG: hypothetical protein ACJAS1_004830 [Oleiphilaceae bacterium]|jgi:hypothetical protein
MGLLASSFVSKTSGIDPIVISAFFTIAIVPFIWSLICLDTQPVVMAPYPFKRAKPASNPQIRKTESTDEKGKKWIHLKYENFLAECPECDDGSKLFICWQNPIKRTRLISKCENSPNDHIYGYDPSNLNLLVKENIK